jgi:hypothetical protein
MAMSSKWVIALIAAFFVCALAPAAFAQSGADEQKRGSLPPGSNRGESRPMDGAIIGGAITPYAPLPGEPQRAIERCRQLGGVLRDECLQTLRASANDDASPYGVPGDLAAATRAVIWRAAWQ